MTVKTREVHTLECDGCFKVKLEVDARRPEIPTGWSTLLCPPYPSDTRHLCPRCTGVVQAALWIGKVRAAVEQLAPPEDPST